MFFVFINPVIVAKYVVALAARDRMCIRARVVYVCGSRGIIEGCREIAKEKPCLYRRAVCRDETGLVRVDTRKKKR